MDGLVIENQRKASVVDAQNPVSKQRHECKTAAQHYYSISRHETVLFWQLKPWLFVERLNFFYLRSAGKKSARREMRPRNGAPLRSKPRPNIWHLHRASETGGWIWKVADTRLIGRDVQALARSFFCEGDWHGDCSTRPTGAVKWHPRGEIPSMDLGTGSSHLPLHCDLPGPSAIHPALTNRRGKQTQPRRQPPTFFSIKRCS